MSSESTETHSRRDRPRRAWVRETVRRIQRGEAVERHFELLFREYEPAVRQRLRKLGWRGPDLDDVAQDVMLRVYRGIGRFRHDASFDTWILQIMHNTARNALRDRKSAKARVTRGASLDELRDGAHGETLHEPASREADPLDEALAGERKARLKAALEELPARVRQCLLFRYQGYKYREIAAAQGVTIDTVKKQVSQGHRRLRPILGRFVEMFGVVLLGALLLFGILV